MATLSGGWYKGGIPFYEITDVSVAVTGSGAESWESDGIMCHRNGTKVTIVSNNMTAIGEKAFFKFLALKKVSGLSSVTTIGAYAFCYTPNIASIDIAPGNLTSIGASAFRMSSAEDVLDLSSVSLSIVGDMATRHKRWGTDGLASVQSVSFPKSVYMEVPNMDSQFAYPDVQYGIKNGEPHYVDNGGCSALTCYHIWNAMFAGTEKQFDNWLDWYNAIVNTDGNYANENVFDGNVFTRLVSKIGWISGEQSVVDSASQLQVILDNLRKKFPTYISINSVNSPNVYHAVAIVGCDAKTRKLAVVDSSVLDNRGVVSWVAFEDIFVGGSSEYDGILLISFDFPVLAPNYTWFTQGGTNVAKTSITEINIKDRYTPIGNVTASWDASAAKDGSIVAYVEDTKLTIVGNGHGKISLNPDSSKVFSGDSADARFTNLKSINGGNILDTSNVTNASKMFNYCSLLESIDVSNWATCNFTTLHTMFQNCASIRGLDVSCWDTGNVTSMIGMFNMSNETPNTTLKTLDVSGWDVSKVTDMQSMFKNCTALNELDVSKWHTSSCVNMQYMFGYCKSLKNLNLSNFDTTKATSLIGMLGEIFAIEKITLGEKFSFNGNGNLSNSYSATMPIPRVDYIPGATGNWYDVHGNAIAPSEVPDQKHGVYYSSSAIAEEDMAGMVLVKKKNLMRTAAAIRSKLGSGKAYTHDEFADALLEGV